MRGETVGMTKKRRKPLKLVWYVSPVSASGMRFGHGVRRS
jgi:hypothetical protein